MKLKDEVALLTDAASGITRPTVKMFLKSVTP